MASVVLALALQAVNPAPPVALPTVTPTPRPIAPAPAIMERGWAELHDLDYEAATRSFRQVQRLDGSQPQGFLSEAVAVWLRELERRQDLDVARFIDARHFANPDGRVRDVAAEERIGRLLARARTLAETNLAERPDDVDSLYQLGTTYGVEAGFEATVRHRVGDALEAAKIAWRIQTRVIELDPEYWDAYFTLGLYDYTAGSLPAFVRWFAFLAGYHGDKARGIEQLELVAERGRSARRDAQVFLTVLYVREGRVEEALGLVHRLMRDAPHNHILRLNAAHCLYWLGRYHESAARYAEALAVARPTARLPREAIRLRQARALLHGGAAVEAQTLTDELLADAGLDPELATRARLLHARCLDTVGERAAAIQAYLAVVRS